MTVTDRTPDRRVRALHAGQSRLILGIGSGLVLGACLAALLGARGGTEPAARSAMPATEATVAVPAPDLAREPVVRAVRVDSSPAPRLAVESQAASAPPQPLPPQVPAPLGRDEVREAQARLRTLGFDPGPVDGAVGPRTEAASQRYRQERGLGELGGVDRVLLDELRDDPTAPTASAPAAASPAAAQPRPARPPPARRAPDPFSEALWRIERLFR
jgi:hypothetical protein